MHGVGWVYHARFLAVTLVANDDDGNAGLTAALRELRSTLSPAFLNLLTQAFHLLKRLPVVNAIHQ